MAINKISEFPKGLKDNDIIYIVFRKDSSAASGDDRGYVLIPKV